MSDTNRYLRVIEGELKAGENLEYDDLYMQMEDLATNSVAALSSSDDAEGHDADYKALLKVTSTLLDKTRDFRVAVFHTIALTAAQGFKGLKDGLTLLGFISVELWDEAYPQLDPDDDLDPTERLNILSTLSPTSINDPFAFLQLVSNQAFCPPLPITARDVKIAKGIISSDADSDIVLLKGQILSLPDAIYAEHYQLLTSCLDTIHSLEQAVNDKLTDGSVLSLEKLQQEISFIVRFLDEARGRPVNLQATANPQELQHQDRKATSLQGSQANAFMPNAAQANTAQINADTNMLATMQDPTLMQTSAAAVSSETLAQANRQAFDSSATNFNAHMAASALNTESIGGSAAGISSGLNSQTTSVNSQSLPANAANVANVSNAVNMVPLAAYQQLQLQVQQLQVQLANQMQIAAAKNDVASMVIESRKDALALIEKCRVYFQKKEPTSPVPFLLQRALNMADMNFIELLGEIDSSALERGREQLGVKNQDND